MKLEDENSIPPAIKKVSFATHKIVLDVSEYQSSGISSLQENHSQRSKASEYPRRFQWNHKNRRFWIGTTIFHTNKEIHT